MVDLTGSVTGTDGRQNLTNPIDLSQQSNDPKFLVSAKVDLGVPLEDVTVKEVIVGESLLNPSAYSVVTLQSAMFFRPQNWDYFRCKPIAIDIADNNNMANNPRTMKINQTVYRCDNRHFTVTNTGNAEELSLHSIDQSILNDAKTVWEKSWKCATPASIVNEALQKIGATNAIINRSTGPGRPYVAESIHPLQVIQQQANVALFDGDDPSFIHYMTIREQTGQAIHHFRPLGELMKSYTSFGTGHEAYNIYAADTAITGGTGFADSYFTSTGMNKAVTFTFPCDYDILSDILNGVDCNGRNLNDVRTFNLASGEFSSAMGAISQAANIFKSITNLGTAQQQNSCETNVEKYLLKRQARMGLLERDKIALRITVPWSPWLHVGNLINFHWNNRYDPSYEQYGSGKYLILNLTHNIQYGGYAVTTLDCIANTFGR